MGSLNHNLRKVLVIIETRRVTTSEIVGVKRRMIKPRRMVKPTVLKSILVLSHPKLTWLRMKMNGGLIPAQLIIIMAIETCSMTGPDPDTPPGFPGWSRLVKSHCTIPREYPMEPHFKKESKHVH